MQYRLTLQCALIFLSTIVTAQKPGASYNYIVDLTKVINDRVFVELTPPPTSKKTISFFLPKVIPGTYSNADYGRYIKDFQAIDKNGKKLPVEYKAPNLWVIQDAKNISRIRYWVDDTFDTQIEGPEIFWPAGTNIEENKNFIINSSGFFGYFEGLKELPFQVQVVRPREMFGATGLIPAKAGVTRQSIKLGPSSTDGSSLVDIYKTSDYDELIDSPIMYSRPDTAIIKAANTEVLVGIYSPNRRITAREVAASIREILMAQKDFLKGNLPVEKYAFIMYFTDQPVTSYGALEHSYSSMYYMPEMSAQMLSQELKDIAAHEFFHIVTPLTIHSEQIEFFDYNAPEMSRHLWMYEGTTEYFASLVQVKAGLITPEEYLQTIREKIMASKNYRDDVAFTDISRYTLDKYPDQYDNVYLKGALIGLCLDIRLLELSGGKYGLRDLMLDLSKKYGKKKAFRDSELFDEITKMTFPEIRDFFKKYVEGTEPLPLAEYLKKVGVEYSEESRVTDYSLGINNSNLGVEMVDNQLMLQIASTEDLNEMGKALGFQEGDILLKLNGDNFPAIASPGDSVPDIGPEFGAFVEKHVMALSSAKELSYTIKRKNQAGVYEEKRLTAPVKPIEIVRRDWLDFGEQPTPATLALQEAWLTEPTK